MRGNGDVRFAVRPPVKLEFVLAAGLALCAMALGQEHARTSGPPVTVERIDGTMVKGFWAKSETNEALSVESEDGRSNFRWADVARVEFSASASQPATGSCVFYISGGGRLVGELEGGESDALTASTSLGASKRFPFDQLAGVELASRADFPNAALRFDELLNNRLAARDVLVTRDNDDVKTVRGRLESLDPNIGKFFLGSSTRTFQTERLFGVVFALGTGDSKEFLTVAVLRDGSRVPGVVEHSSADRLQFKTTLGFSAELPLSRIREILVRSPRLVFLSDLSMEVKSSEGRLHAGWPVVVDRNVAGGPLRIGGKQFDRGLGMHSKSVVSYALNGRYEEFIATVGLDDSVGPRGSVVFTVEADSRVLFDSGIVTGADSPLDIRVDVKNVKKLTLIVDYGDGLDLSDYANWGAARLIKIEDGYGQ